MKFSFLILLFSLCSYAANFKVRAREHVEIHELHNTNSIEMYKGLTNTINAWWEVPYQYSFGFSFSPIIASIKADDSDSAYGEKITQQNIGFEIKNFFTKSVEHLFSRLGLGYTRLETTRGDTKNFFGNYAYLGLGYEIPYDQFGLALEMAYRYADYNDNLYIKTISPSIGFHFYKNL